MSDEKKGDGNDVIIIMILAFAAVYAIGYFLGDYIKLFYLTLKLYELKLLALIYTTDDMAFLIDKIETKQISSWTWKELTIVGGYVGNIVNWFILVGMGYFVYKVWKKSPYKKLTRSLDMFGLMDSEKKIWPFIVPIAHTNLLNEKLDSGLYAMGMKPLEFVNKFKLLDRPRDLTSLNKMKAEKLFSSQLGKLWDGVDNMSTPAQALYAIFAAQAMGEEFKDASGKTVKSIEAARTLVKALCTSTDGGKKPNFKLAKELIERYKNDERILVIMNKHAYVYTALATLYLEACKNGVLPPNNFLWLRVINRPLYYFLHCVGRRVSFVEVAGIYGHWKAELVCKHPIEKPYVVKARDGLDKALQEVKLPDE